MWFLFNQYDYACRLCDCFASTTHNFHEGTENSVVCTVQTYIYLSFFGEMLFIQLAAVIKQIIFILFSFIFM